MREPIQIVRPLHPKDRLPFYSLAELLIPFEHPVFVPKIMSPPPPPKPPRVSKPRAKLKARGRPKDNRKAMISDMLDDKKNTLEIANFFGISRQAVASAIRRLGLQIPFYESAFFIEHGDDVKKLCAHIGISKTARHYSKNYVTIRAFLERQK